mmetsp:Transcript_32413/g.36807  ORF Transcript_32413/g.36807 Transcript_32413/m.36807 type:complete len:201 (-) Transcript_32413:355-957(-)
MASQHSATCAICLECFGTGGVQHAPTPCCERDTSSVRFCLRCLELVCRLSPFEENIAHCPRCRRLVRVEDGIVRAAQLPQRRGRCRMCCQIHVLVNQYYCSACQQGTESGPLRYECQECHGIQRIHHPMYRYQEAHDRFAAGSTWACHVGCEDQRRWRIVSQDVHRISADDIPPSWNIEDPVVVRVRQFRLGGVDGNGTE